MIVLDVVAVTLAAVLVNHMGLIEAIEGIIRYKLPVINCSRCLTFWASLAVLIASEWTSAIRHMPVIVATSFLAAYAAQWIELLFGIIDKQYDKIYAKIYPEETAKAKAEAEAGADTAHAESAETRLSEMREINNELS